MRGGGHVGDFLDQFEVIGLEVVSVAAADDDVFEFGARRDVMEGIFPTLAAAGDFEIRLLVRDTESPKFGALRIPVSIPAFPATVFVSSPMVTDDPFARVALPTVTERRPGKEVKFEDAKDIVKEVYFDRLHDHVAAHLRGKAKVTVNPPPK